MSLSQKITLENRIFARAARTRARVEGVRGILQTDSAEVQLQLLICIYNAFFGAENREFCKEDTAAQIHETLALQARYSAEEKRLGPLGPGLVKLQKKFRSNPARREIRCATRRCGTVPAGERLREKAKSVF